jgi:hypothetical protein
VFILTGMCNRNGLYPVLTVQHRDHVPTVLGTATNDAKNFMMWWPLVAR